MSHNIFGGRVVLNRVPAWHRLGQVFEEPLTAFEAHNAMTPPTITLEQAFAKLPSLSDTKRRPASFSLPIQAIVRHPVPGDPEYKVFGTVGPEYVLVDPLTFSEIWDRSTNLKIESAAFLGSGETFFLSSRLPSFSVKGVDQVDLYLLGVSHYTGGRANELIISPVRTVCQNTLVLARNESRESYAVEHNAEILPRLEKWLALMSGNLEAKILRVQDSCTRLAGIRIGEDALASALFQIYPDPKPWKRTPENEINAKRQADYEYYLKQAQSNRVKVKELYEGAGTGLDSGELQGTAWFVYQAVTEFENYRRTTDPSAAARDTLFGFRGQTMERAWDVLQKMG